MTFAEWCIVIYFIPGVIALFWGIFSGTGERIYLKPPPRRPIDND